MYEMTDITEQEEPEIESRPSIVSFPDHYIVPYIEMCKRSRRATCIWSIFFIGLAIFCFFATNYMINYPVTEARKIAFVMAGVCCLVAAASCLNLRFRITQCGDGLNNNIQFEIARRNTDFSDSLSGNSNMHETSFFYGTPIDGPSHTETPEDMPSRTQSMDDPCSARVSTFRSNGHARLPRHSISDGMTPNAPLLPQRRGKLSRPSLQKKSMDSRQFQDSGNVSDSNTYSPSYSTFENGCEASNNEPLLSDSTHQNGCDTLETEPLLAKKS